MNGATLLATDFLRHSGVQFGIDGISALVSQAPCAHHFSGG